VAQIFGAKANTVSRWSRLGGVILLGAVGLVLWLIPRSSYVTEVGVLRTQPVPFRRKHHVGDDGFDCRYCHASVEITGLYWHFVDIVWIFLFSLLYLIERHR